MSLESPLDQTFGVEIECIVEGSLKQFAKESLPLTDDEQWRFFSGEMYQALVAADIRVYNPQNVEGPAQYDTWFMAIDSSIVLDHGFEMKTGYGYQQLEIRSPILRPDRSGFSEVRKVLQAMQSRFTLLTNTSCGLHIHSGNNGKLFPFPTLKRFVQLVTGFESILHTLHTDDRLDVSWANPPSKSFTLLESDNPFTRLMILNACNNQQALWEVFQEPYERNWAYNLQNIDLSKDRSLANKQTIEFRQHEGTVDAEEIVAWAKFCNAMVQFAHNISSAQLIELLCRYSTDENFGILELMRIMNKKKLADHFSRRLHSRKRPDIDIAKVENNVHQEWTGHIHLKHRW